MEETQLQLEEQQYLIEVLPELKRIMQKQVQSFSSLLANHILEKNKSIDKTRLEKVFLSSFITPVCQEYDYLFEYLKNSQLKFYNTQLKTADMIFKTKLKERNKKIYLNNIINEINEQEEKIEEIFTISASKRLVQNDKSDDNNQEEVEELFTESTKNIEEENKLDNNPSLNTIYSNFVKKLLIVSHMQGESVEDLYTLAAQYYKKFQIDVATTIYQFLSGNKNFAITRLEEEMKQRNLIELTHDDRLIVKNSVNEDEKLLDKTIEKYKKEAKDELKQCSPTIFNLIFKLLPAKYQDQKLLLEVIVKTNIYRKLSSILDSESEELSNNLKYKNKDVIENEFYKEKRYRHIDDYESTLTLETLDGIYRNVIDEICNAYDIPETDISEYGIKSLVSQQAGIEPKNIFNRFFRKVKLENNKNLSGIVVQMHIQRGKNKVASENNGYGQK